MKLQIEEEVVEELRERPSTSSRMKRVVREQRKNAQRLERRRHGKSEADRVDDVIKNRLGQLGELLTPKGEKLTPHELIMREFLDKFNPHSQILVESQLREHAMNASLNPDYTKI